MPKRTTRRLFLGQAAALAAGVAAGPGLITANEPQPASQPAGPQPAKRPRVVIARDEALTRGKVDEHAELLRKLLDVSMQRLTGAADAPGAWRKLFKPTDRVGLKVNTLGLATQPAVVDAIVAGLRQAGVPAGNIIIWDRFDKELVAAGFKLSQAAGAVQCRGTDAEHYGSGYQQEVETSGQIGSCFSRIIAEQVDALISVPVLKDHALAGVTLGMKNFFGAIHNPNKYHDNHCDPYIVDVVSHRFIRPRWRLTICDGTHGQYNAGPTRHPGFAWLFGGLILGTDFVAADAVAADLLEAERKNKGLKALKDDDRPRPFTYIATAAARGLGVADLDKIERIEV